jgi:hypothetical protein
MQTEDVNPEKRVLGIKFKDLSPFTSCFRHFGFFGDFKFDFALKFENIFFYSYQHSRPIIE